MVSLVASLARLTVVVVVTTTLACHRTELIPLDGPIVTDTRHQTTFINEPAAVGELRGVVVHLGVESPLSDAELQLDSFSPIRTAGDGRFTFTGVAPGRHVLTTRRVGYTAGVDTVQMTATNGLVLRIGLGPRLVATPPLSIPRRKPWWKFW